jgi:hypothetical protein
MKRIPLAERVEALPYSSCTDQKGQPFDNLREAAFPSVSRAEANV